MSKGKIPDSIKILIVDRDANMLEVCRDVLERAGCIAQTTNSIDGLIAKLLDEPPELLLLDFDMPEIDSLTFLHEIQRSVPSCCIIGTSVCASPTLVEAAIQEKEICDYLTKPFSIEQLKMSIYRCMKRLKLVKREEEFGIRVRKVRDYLRDVVINLEKLS